MLTYTVSCNCRKKIFKYTSRAEFDKEYDNLKVKSCPVCNTTISNCFINLGEGNLIPINIIN